MCPCNIHTELSIYWKCANGYPCVYAISMNHGYRFQFFWMDLEWMDFSAWISPWALHGYFNPGRRATLLSWFHQFCCYSNPSHLFSKTIVLPIIPVCFVSIQGLGDSLVRKMNACPTPVRQACHFTEISILYLTCCLMVSLYFWLSYASLTRVRPHPFDDI